MKTVKTIRFWSDMTWIEEDRYTSEAYAWKGPFFEICMSLKCSDAEVDDVVRLMCRKQNVPV